MKSLNADWFLEGHIDFEYKKYTLLAYLQYVSREFAEVHLYPSLAELVFHYNNLSTFRDEKDKLRDRFPKRLNEQDLKNLKLTKETSVEDPEDIQEISTIVDYAIPEIHQHLKEGKEIYDYIEGQIQIEPIGITPLYQKEGYILLQIHPHKQVQAYDYKIVFFENTDANYYGISLTQIDSYRYSVATTYEAIKHQLIREHKKYPNPATYLVYTVQPFPKESTLLPVAKRKILSYLK